MSSSYEVWLTDDAGRRMALLGGKEAFFAYSRTLHGYGTVQYGMPFRKYNELVPSFFQPDWRLDIWRSPGFGFPKRRERSYLLRKINVYRREDGMEIVELLGRCAKDILRRENVMVEETATKTDYADDMMKDIVRYYFIDNPAAYGPSPYIQTAPGVYASTGEFSCDGDYSLGPTITMSFLYGSILDILQDIQAITAEKHRNDSSNRRIYFDVVESSGLPNGFGYVFRTYADLYGQDRTQGSLFSVENGNLKDPVYYEDYLDQVTKGTAIPNDPVAFESRTARDSNLSRWNLIRRVENIGSDDVNETLARTEKIVDEYKADKSINCTFLNTPGGPTQPRSLYGIDWDLGDILPVQFAKKLLQAEVNIVYVAVNEDGEETITGRNEVGAQ